MASIDPATSQEKLMFAVNKTKALQYINNGIALTIIFIAVLLEYAALIIL